MSFLSDAFEGNWSKLGTDITHAPESLAKHPSELYETLGGLGALATGGLALGALGGEGAALGLGGFLGEGGADVAGAAVGGGTDALAFTGADAGASTLGGPGLDAITGALGGGGGVSTGAGSEAIAAGADLTGVTPSIGDAVTGAGSFGSDTAAAGGGGSSFLGDLGKGALSSVTKNPLGIAAAGGLLGYDFLKGNPVDPNQKALQQKAGELGAQGQVLQSYLASGTLPPALKAQLDKATAAEKARIVSGYASRGMPTDPNQNSALAQELNNVDTNAVAAMASAQIQMLNTGLQETGLSTQLYETLVKLDSAQNDSLMKAISSFAAALGGGGGMTLKLA